MRHDMNEPLVLSGVIIDEIQLTIDELARACAVERHWIVERVSEGFLGYADNTSTNIQIPEQSGSDENNWRFASHELMRAKKLISFERDFDANPELAALLVDLLEEIAALKRRMN